MRSPIFSLSHGDSVERLVRGFPGTLEPFRDKTFEFGCIEGFKIDFLENRKTKLLSTCPFITRTCRERHFILLSRLDLRKEVEMKN